MTFLSPIMLWGALAAGIPIALHLFFRSRYRTVPWAAMKFLLTSIEQTSRRLRFQELLLLVVRCLVLALLALALARPLSAVVRGAGGGDAVDAVFVFDVSYSMGASDGAMNRLQRAQAAALQILDQLPAHSTVQVVTCADRAKLLGPRSPGNLDQAKSLIADLQLTALASDFYPGMVEAADILGRGQATNKELYLFSDQQQLGWEQQSANLVAKLKDIKEKTSIVLVRCGDPKRTIGNAAIVGLTPQKGVPRSGERVDFAVLVRNTGSEVVKDVKLFLSVDGDEKKAETQMIERLLPGETRVISLAVKLEKPGLRVLTAQLGHDDLPGDNRFDQVVLVRDTVNILVIDGGINERDPERSSSYFLGHALAPVKDSDRAKYYLQQKVYSPRLAAPALLAKQDLCILVNCPLQSELKERDALPADFLDELEKFVRQGKGLIIYAGEHVKAESYNRLLGQKHGLLPLPVKGFAEFSSKDTEPIRLNRASVGIPAYVIFKEDNYYKSLSEALVWKAVALEEKAKPEATTDKPNGAKASAAKNEPDATAVALRFSNGLPAVALKQVGAGATVFIATSADPGFKKDSPDLAWTDWPFSPANVPFINVTVSHLLQTQSQTYNVPAGQQVDYQLPSDAGSENYLRILKAVAPDLTADEEKAVLKMGADTFVTQNFTLKKPDGEEERLGYPERRNSQLVVPLTDLTRGGVYRLSHTRAGRGPLDDLLAKKGAIPIAVTPDLRDSESLDSLSDEQIDGRLGFRPTHLRAGEVFDQTGADRLNREWTLWLLALVLILTALEMVLAWWCGKAW